MSNDIQRYADALADELNRSIEIDDPGLFPIAVTEQHGDIDDVRIRSILQRHSSPEVYEYAFSLDIAHASGPVRYPPQAELKSLPRVCIPLRYQQQLQGYLWLIDSPPLTESELGSAVTAAQTFAEILHGRAQSTLTELDSETTLVQRLFDDPLAIGEHDELVRTQPLLDFETNLTVITTRIASGSHAVDSLTRPRIRDALQEVIYARPTGRSLIGVDSDLVHLIVSTEVTSARLQPFRRALFKAAQRRGWVLRGTGVGTPASSLRGLRNSSAHSTFAATIAHARRVEELAWSELGTDIAFYGLSWTPQTVNSFFPGASCLLDDNVSLLRESLDAYFRFGGDTRRAASYLAVHRTTLYYRLDRVRELLGGDWTDGDRRYGLDSALRLVALITALKAD
ncbi:hypothetical protein DBV08_18145 [Rhodococcus sp. KBW08]|uniref:PucR family transcriptional regulator n=1 Tax=Rhodococcus sp. KBW08 TaxID=2144188 RepID=UPI000F59AE1E|nr:PucR family transcriptional regulator [Rhodococcus sp. KBW08]RQO46070.1 hypothetical protein DBV08_18145 [Rhodococcus sp. KBW08]